MDSPPRSYDLALSFAQADAHGVSGRPTIPRQKVLLKEIGAERKPTAIRTSRPKF